MKHPKGKIFDILGRCRIKVTLLPTSRAENMTLLRGLMGWQNKFT